VVSRFDGYGVLLPAAPRSIWGALIAAARINDGLLVTHPRTSIRLLQLYVVAIFFSSVNVSWDLVMSRSASAAAAAWQ